VLRVTKRFARPVARGRANLFVCGRVGRSLQPHRLVQAGQSLARLAKPVLRAHALEVINCRDERLASGRKIPVSPRRVSREPVTVGQPQLAPFVRCLDLVVFGEASIESLLSFGMIAERGVSQGDNAMRGGLVVALMDLTAMRERLFSGKQCRSRVSLK